MLIPSKSQKKQELSSEIISIIISILIIIKNNNAGLSEKKRVSQIAWSQEIKKKQHNSNDTVKTKKGDAHEGCRTPWFYSIPFECGCCEMLVYRVCGARQNFYVFSLYRTHDIDDRIYDCLLTAMAAVQAADARASLIFVGDLNGHHQKWLGSTITNRHGVAALDFDHCVRL